MMTGPAACHSIVRLTDFKQHFAYYSIIMIYSAFMALYDLY